MKLSEVLEGAAKLLEPPRGAWTQGLTAIIAVLRNAAATARSQDR